jgi:mannose/fructose/N-acetylgalactosamine-specific phosphotransferase system component IID
MSGSPKLPKEIRTQLGVGTVLAIAGTAWMFVIFFVLKPDQIIPTKDYLSDAYDGMRSIAGIPFDQWGLRTIGELAGSFLFLLIMNILYVVARLGWLTLLSLGGFALFEAISGLRKARR